MMRMLGIKKRWLHLILGLQCRRLKAEGIQVHVPIRLQHRRIVAANELLPLGKEKRES